MAAVFEMIPPGDWLVNGHKIYLKPEPAERRPDAWDMPERTYVTELRFTDTNDQTSRRDRAGVLTRVL